MTETALVHQEVLPMNLLVVDDEQYVRQLCADVAVQSGMKVTTVATAEEALHVLENSAVDILVTDLQLAESSGLDLLQEIHDKHREVAVIVLTQFGTIDSAVAATGLGAVDYFTKPFRVEELVARSIHLLCSNVPNCAPHWRLPCSPPAPVTRKKRAWPPGESLCWTTPCKPPYCLTKMAASPG